jgi:hypothetical protein
VWANAVQTEARPMPSRLAISSVEITWRCGYPPCAPTACSVPFALPRELTYRESPDKNSISSSAS